jgi:hypothetical protein
LDQMFPYTQGCDRLPLSSASSWKLHEICDVNDKLGDDMILYRYNEEKTIEWLKQKVLRTAAVVCSKRIASAAAESKAVVDSFRAPNQSSAPSSAAPSPTSEPTEIDIKEAFDIIQDYISDDFGKKIASVIPLLSGGQTLPSDSLVPAKRKADWEVALEVSLFIPHPNVINIADSIWILCCM